MIGWCVDGVLMESVDEKVLMRSVDEKCWFQRSRRQSDGPRRLPTADKVIVCSRQIKASIRRMLKGFEVYSHSGFLIFWVSFLFFILKVAVVVIAGVDAEMSLEMRGWII